jgi:carbamate kinase
MADVAPTAVVALGGNALLPRGEKLEASAQLRAARRAAAVLGPAVERFQLVVTHGNGPQVGLLALMNDAYDEVDPYPLDVLDAESEGQIGYVIELELDNAIDTNDTVALITRVVVDEGDPAFYDPTKFIGPTYDERTARELERERGWTVKPDGDAWRRVVPSPEPRQIVQLPAIRKLVESGFVVVCAGGGGVPVVEEGAGHRGVEAVIDKDRAAAFLASELSADALLLLTDVDAVYEGWGTPGQRALHETTVAHLRSLDAAEGSMGPKIDAVCQFIDWGGSFAAIGTLDDAPALLRGEAGTVLRTTPTQEVSR